MDHKNLIANLFGQIHKLRLKLLATQFSNELSNKERQRNSMTKIISIKNDTSSHVGNHIYILHENCIL